MGATKDMVGLKFGLLTVLRRGPDVGPGKYKKRQWYAACDCGLEALVIGERLRSGDKQSCGCLKGKSGGSLAKNLVGLRFGRLTVLRRGPNKGISVMWWCLCECGTEKLIQSYNLRRVTESCGCLQREVARARLIKEVPEGTRFGLLTVLRRGPDHEDGSVTCYTRCDCGQEKLIPGYRLRSGEYKSCGCAGRRETAAQDKLLIHYKSSAKSRGRVFSLSEEEFLALGVCRK